MRDNKHYTLLTEINVIVGNTLRNAKLLNV